MANKRKTTTAIAAGVTAAALVLGGTFAWTSISQQARNEAIVDINPGGRLHDDFNGTNKDVYVENFSEGATGVPIYARIRLDQYMEIGQQAGLKEADNKKATPIIATDNIDEPEDWETYIPGEDDVINSADPFFKYWKWDLGNGDDDMPYYMPTFNKNKDSLEPDVNGTYEGTVDGDKVHYDNYKTYTEDQTLTADAIYDWDDDTVEEKDPTVRPNENDAWDSADIYKESEEHTAKKITSTANVILMKDWLAMTAEQRAACKAWVYDTDGWAYWSQAIQPGETTGLLLTGIQQIRVPDDSWYYGINVVGQFVTSSDLTVFEADGSLSDGAKELLGFAAGLETTLAVSGPTAVQPGKTYNYSAAMTKAGMAVDTPADLTWSVENVKLTPADDGTQTAAEDVITITKDGTLTIAETVTFDTTFTVTATANGISDSIDVTVVDSWQSQVEAAEVGTTATVEIDGIEWFVLAKEDGKALLLASAPVENIPTQIAFEYGSTVDYPNHDIDQYLSSNLKQAYPFYNNLGTIDHYIDGFQTRLTESASALVEDTIYTIDLYNTMDQSDNESVIYKELTRKVFIPSVADFAGINYSTSVPGDSEKDRTYGYSGLITNEMAEIMLASTESGLIPTRTSPANYDGKYYSSTWALMTVVNGDSGLATGEIGAESSSGIFPMMWVRYEPEATLKITSQNEEGVYYNGEVYSFDASLNDVTWSVTGGNGKSKFLSPGQLAIDAGEGDNTKLTVTATSSGGQTASLDVTVTEVTEIYLFYNNKAYAPNSEITLEAGKDMWFTARGNGGTGVIASVSYDVSDSSITSTEEGTQHTYFDPITNQLVLAKDETGTDGKLTLTVSKNGTEISGSFTLILPTTES